MFIICYYVKLRVGVGLVDGVVRGLEKGVERVCIMGLLLDKNFRGFRGVLKWFWGYVCSI